jgi:hypothetical protein
MEMLQFSCSRRYPRVNTPHLNFQLNCKVRVTLRLTVSQSVSLLGLMTGYLLLFDSYDLGFVGRPL